MRKTVHVDAFFTGVGLPAWAEFEGEAGGRCGPRSVVTTAAYGARQYGVRSAGPAAST